MNASSAEMSQTSPSSASHAEPLWAGVAKVEITDPASGPVNDPLYVKALALRQGETAAVIVTIDAVAIAEIGRIGNDYLAKVRSQIQADLDISPTNILVNASHCHGLVCSDVDQRTVQAVREAWRNMVQVQVGVGAGHEDRIMENRRLRLKDGTEADVRHAYALPPDEEIVGVGPVDPEIGILRLDKMDGQPLAVVYNFACHPIQGVPDRSNTADLTGFASAVIEENVSDGAMALFLQGCAGDINPTLYKDVDHPRDAEPLGNMLGLSTLKALKRIQSGPGGGLKVLTETVELPRADHAQRIAEMEAEQMRLINALGGTSLNLKTFVLLFMKASMFGEFPSYYSHKYLYEEKNGRAGLKSLDKENRRNLDQYMKNVQIMEELTRIQVNLGLLRKHHARNQASGNSTIGVELMGLRIGDFVLIAFPGELSVQTGLDIKRNSPHPHTYVAGVSNGYLYYTATSEQLTNCRRSGTQEDSECILAPGWQAVFERSVAGMLKRL